MTIEGVDFRNTFRRKNFPIIPDDAESVSIEEDDKQYPMRDIAQFVLPMFENNPDSPLNIDQINTLRKIANCKTSECGYNATYCPNCKRITIHTCSCNNRNCPNCQSLEADAWVENRSAERIEGIAHYHAVATSPSILIPLSNANKSVIWGAKMRTSAAAVIKLCRDPKYGGFTPGIHSVFHPNGSLLNDHPHVHMLITGGGLTPSNQFKETSHKHFFIPQAVVAAVFRGMFMEELNKLYDAGKLIIPPPEAFVPYVGQPMDLNDPVQWLNYTSSLYNVNWNFYIKETFNGNGNAIRYMGRYVFRTAISNARIVSTDLTSTEEHPDGLVIFKYKDYTDGGKWKEKELSAREFMLRFLRHVMPKRFNRVRSFGILANPVKTKSLKRIAELMGRLYLVSPLKGKSKSQLIAILYDRDVTVCPVCSHKLEQIGKFYNLEVIRSDQMAS